MPDTTHVTYLFDPLCGWCYGASPILENLASRPEFTVELLPTGLFAGEGARPMDAHFAAYAWSNDQRIGRLTRQIFSDDYRRAVLGDHSRLLDSGPATLALTAVSLTDPTREMEALKAIQRARYVDGRDNTSRDVLVTVLMGLGLQTAADRFLAPDDAVLDAHRQRIATARATMHRFNADGVPTLIVGAGENRRRLSASALMAGIDTLLSHLKAA